VLRLTINGVQYAYTKHVVDRLQSLSNVSKQNVETTLLKILRSDRTFVAQRHTSALAIMLNDFKRATYLWSPEINIVLVLSCEETIPIFVTAYKASESSWLQTYLSRTPPDKRIKFQNWLESDTTEIRRQHD
jgi:hypothetical protein